MSKALSQWLVSLGLYMRICLFAASPSDLPYSPNSLLLTLIVYFIAAVVLLGNELGLLSITAHLALEGLVLYALCRLILKFKGQPTRILQTLSALFGSSLIFSLLSIPLLLWIPDSGVAEPETASRNLNLVLLLWNLAVISLIFKRAFEISTLSAGILAFNYFLVYQLIVINLLQ